MQVRVLLLFLLSLVATVLSFSLPSECNKPTVSRSLNTAKRSTTKPWQTECCLSIRQTFAAQCLRGAHMNYTLCTYVASKTARYSNTIKAIDLKDCKLSGAMPDNFQYFRAMTQLDLSDNSIEGELKGFWNEFDSLLPKLASLKVANNELSGLVPSNVFQYTSLISADFSKNAHLTLSFDALNYTLNKGVNTDASNSKIIFKHALFDSIKLASNATSFAFFLTRLRVEGLLSLTASTNSFTYDWSAVALANVESAVKYKNICIGDFNVSSNNLIGDFIDMSLCADIGMLLQVYKVNGNAFETKSADLTWLESDKSLKYLTLLQKRQVYDSSKARCLPQYELWAPQTDFADYCRQMEAVNERCHKVSGCPQSKQTTTATPKTTKKGSKSKGLFFWMHNKAAMLGLALGILLLLCIVYLLLRRLLAVRKKHGNGVDDDTAMLKYTTMTKSPVRDMMHSLVIESVEDSSEAKGRSSTRGWFTRQKTATSTKKKKKKKQRSERKAKGKDKRQPLYYDSDAEASTSLIGLEPRGLGKDKAKGKMRIGYHHAAYESLTADQLPTARTANNSVTDSMQQTEHSIVSASSTLYGEF